MKSLFFVHSPITVLVSHLVIAHKNIPKTEVIFLTARGASVKDKEYKIVDYPYADGDSAVPQTRNLFKCAHILKNFDRFLNNLVGSDSFECYVPQNSLRGLELLINAPSCIGFSLIEEGSASYYPIEQLNKEYGNPRRSIWDRIGYKNRIGKKYFFRPDYRGVYGITVEAFPGFKNRCILPLEGLKNESYQQYNGQAFLIYDDILLAHILEEADVCKRINAALHNTKPYTKLFYKFHPRHTKDQKEAMRKLMYREMTILLEELPQDFSIEVLAVNAKDLTFIMNLSSLGLYGGLFGHKVYSFAEWLFGTAMHPELLYGKAKGYEDFVNDMPEIYKQHIIFWPKEAATSNAALKSDINNFS